MHERMIIKMKETFFSKEALEFLQSRYPHINKSMFNGLLNMYGLEMNRKTTDVGLVVETSYRLEIPEDISNALGIENGIYFPRSINVLYFEPEKNIDVIDALMYAYEHMGKQENKHLLTIKLEDESSVPKVFHKGEEITKKVRLSFDWETDTDECGGLSYAIEHYENCASVPTLNLVERKVKGHAFD